MPCARSARLPATRAALLARTLLARAALALAVLFGPVLPLAAETRLLMFEQAGCVYCARWHEEVGPGHPLSPEGQIAPLVSVPLRAPLPDGVTLRSRPAFTPTFVLIRDGQEVGRIEGYPGAHFFWPMLGELLQTAAE